MKMFGNKKHMTDKENNAVKRFEAYQKKADKAINRRVMNTHMNRRG